VLSRAFRVTYPRVFRRLAALSDAAGVPSLGLAICDGSGAMLFRKPADGFPLPLLGSGCPLWPLYQMLGRPNVPARELLELGGRIPRRFDTYTIAETWPARDFGGPQVTRCYMLILPSPDPAEAVHPAPIGTTCRICARADCAARREPAVIGTAD
jgi:predicted transcriptional regulator